MHSGKLVFAKFMEHLPLHTFRLGVRRYPAKYPTKTFSHLDQFLIMAFAQLTYRESLRDIETCRSLASDQALSSGYPQPRRQERIGRCQRTTRLAHLRRFRHESDPNGTQALRERLLRRGVGSNRLCASRRFTALSRTQ